MATQTLAQETVELANGRTQVVFRAGEGPPLVWLHAADGIQPEHPIVQALAGRYSVVVPLAPGFDDLAELDDVWDIHDLAMHYDDVFEALGLDDATVIGHSFGAMVGAELAAHYPRRVGRLVLIAPVGLWNDDYPVTDLFAVNFPDLPELLFRDEAVAAIAFPRTEGDPDVETMVTLAKGMTSVAKFMWPIPDRGLARRLYRISARTLVLFGQEDALVPARYADDFVAGIRNATKVIVPGAGHMVPIERPEETLAAIEEFFKA
jgi:pimeloyl-ACP methyl ester carboxylesterase